MEDLVPRTPEGGDNLPMRREKSIAQFKQLSTICFPYWDRARWFGGIFSQAQQSRYLRAWPWLSWPTVAVEKQQLCNGVSPCGVGDDKHMGLSVG